MTRGFKTVVGAGALLAVLAMSGSAQAKSFREKQATASRVIAARKRVEGDLRRRFAELGLSYPARRMLIRAFKKERELELWAGDAKGALKRVRHWPFCAMSGRLGPKRRRGDLQIPEGIYFIDRYNAWSNFHLSLGVNYPNASDRVRGHKANLGGDIFIHGDCVTIGCIPIEDGPIEVLYIAALDARLAGLRRVPVHIFPGRLDDAGIKKLESLAGENKRLVGLWRELQPIYAAFEAKKQVPKVRIEPRSGRYVLRR